MARLLLIGLLLLGGGCSCGDEERSTPTVHRPRAEPRAPAARRDVWPVAVIELSPQPPATRITIRPSHVHIDNEALVHGWPDAVIVRARATPMHLYPDWPRLSYDLDEPAEDDVLFALEQTRLAERLGGGAGVIDLRVASDVRFARLSQTLLTAAHAGYDRTRLLLDGPDGALLAFEWRHAPVFRQAPSLDEIRAAMGALERGESPELEQPAPTTHRARVRYAYEGERVQVYVADTPVSCDIETPAMVGACVRSLGVSGVTLDVDGRVRFGDVIPYWQHLSLATDSLAVRAR